MQSKRLKMQLFQVGIWVENLHWNCFGNNWNKSNTGHKQQKIYFLMSHNWHKQHISLKKKEVKKASLHILLDKGNGTEDILVVLPLAEYFGRRCDKRVFIEFPLFLSTFSTFTLRSDSFVSVHKFWWIASLTILRQLCLDMWFGLHK